MSEESVFELLEIVDIYYEGEIPDDELTIDLGNYEEFNKVYNRLEKNIEVERDSDQTSLNEEAAHIVYLFKDLLVVLVALFDTDKYSLTIYEEN